MRILNIVETIVDGPGLRTSIYFAGCKHNCKGCHNPESHNFNGGYEINASELLNKIDKIGNKNITLTGGDPMFQWNQVSTVVAMLHRKGYNIWLYTGFKFEELKPNDYPFIGLVDVIVDGKYDDALKCEAGQFKGSVNQLIIDVKETIRRKTLAQVDIEQLKGENLVKDAHDWSTSNIKKNNRIHSNS